MCLELFFIPPFLLCFSLATVVYWRQSFVLFRSFPLLIALFTVGTTRVSNPLCYSNLRISASISFDMCLRLRSYCKSFLIPPIHLPFPCLSFDSSSYIWTAWILFTPLVILDNTRAVSLTDTSGTFLCKPFGTPCHYPLCPLCNSCIRLASIVQYSPLLTPIIESLPCFSEGMAFRALTLAMHLRLGSLSLQLANTWSSHLVVGSDLLLIRSPFDSHVLIALH